MKVAKPCNQLIPTPLTNLISSALDIPLYKNVSARFMTFQVIVSIFVVFGNFCVYDIAGQTQLWRTHMFCSECTTNCCIKFFAVVYSSCYGLRQDASRYKTKMFNASICLSDSLVFLGLLSLYNRKLQDLMFCHLWWCLTSKTKVLQLPSAINVNLGWGETK